MALFKRSTLKEKGLTEDQIEFIMSESARSLTDYTLKSEVQSQIDAAVETAKAGFTPDIKNSDEYKALQGEFDAYKERQTAKASDDFKGVKSKFFDAVYDRIDKSKPIPEQLTAIKAEYEEFFEPEQEQKPQEGSKPTFGGRSEGGMPTGKPGGASMFSAWGYDERFKKGN
jgi:hypothetical protein